MKKYILITLCAIAVLILITGISGIGAAYFFPTAISHPAQAECTLTVPVQPGEVVSCSVPVTLPAGMRIAGAEISGENIMPLAVSVSGGRYLWNRRVWHISGVFRILKEGKLANSALEFGVRRIFSSKIRENIRIPLPEITSALGQTNVPGAELALAGNLTPPEENTLLRSWHWLWLLLLLLLPVIAVCGYWFWKKFFRRIILPAPWERALHEVEKLRNRVKRKKLSAEKAFSALADVVRDYLELRFALPAPRRTTQEFMQSFLHDPESPLPEEQRNFLSRFLAASDMIKFACAASDETAFDRAAARAGELIRVTAEEEKQK